MQVIVESRSAEASALRSVAENRLRVVLRRLAWRIPKARVSLSDLNGPKGGEDKHVQVELRLTGGSSGRGVRHRTQLAQGDRYRACQGEPARGPHHAPRPSGDHDGGTSARI